MLAGFFLLPFLMVLEGKGVWQGFGWGYLAGLIFFLGVLYWLVHVSLIGLFLLAMYLALYWGIFGVFASYSLGSDRRMPGAGLWRPAFLAGCWVILEYIRSHLLTGFGWGLVGYVPYLHPSLIQIADITGVWGVSFLIVFLNVSLWQGWRLIKSKQKDIRVTASLLLSMALLLFNYGYGRWSIQRAREGEGGIKVALIQPNIAQEEKWEPRQKGQILARNIALTESVLRYCPSLIIWPETAIPGYLLDEPLFFDTMASFLKKLSGHILVGTVIGEADKYFNSALLLDREAAVQARYDKLHLVPFGEYVPGRRFWGTLVDWIPIGDFSPGRHFTLFPLPYLEEAKKPVFFSVLICFEDIFPQLAREFRRRGASFLAVITNDAWFKKTSSPYQHLQASVFRAVENRMYVVRSANTGISCIIDSLGRIAQKVHKDQEDIFVSGYCVGNIRPAGPLSFYTRFGDIFVWGCILVCGCVIITNYLLSRKSSRDRREPLN